MVTKSKSNPAPATSAVNATPPEVESLIESARKAWNANLSADMTFVVEASKATYAARKAGLIGKGQRWASGEAFGLEFPDRDGKGASKSTVTRWGRCGKAYDLGVTPVEYPVEWPRLVSKANDPRIGKVIDREGATAKQIVAAIKKCFPRGKFVEAPKVTTPPAGDSETPVGTPNGNTQPDSEAQASKVPNSAPAMLELMESIATALTAARPKGLSKAESEKLANVLAILDTLVTAKTADRVELGA